MARQEDRELSVGLTKYQIKMNIESILERGQEKSTKALETSDTRMLGMKGIKKATRLKKDELMAALGFQLGRAKAKIAIAEEDEDTVVTLV